MKSLNETKSVGRPKNWFTEWYRTCGLSKATTYRWWHSFYPDLNPGDATYEQRQAFFAHCSSDEYKQAKKKKSQRDYERRAATAKATWERKRASKHEELQERILASCRKHLAELKKEGDCCPQSPNQLLPERNPILS